MNYYIFNEKVTKEEALAYELQCAAECGEGYKETVAHILQLCGYSFVADKNSKYGFKVFKED